ncbi:DUF72 domain-containing protein [Pusillimonas sp. ANT_WB101]|uniref:DUF72 domain-containing protein n=1 Tax=Pusillimonas sp. ANT_WB101 TaxID=2597356 RepID=UPI003519F1F8
MTDIFPTEGSHLKRYAQVFSAVEVNSSFYRTHQPKTYERWAASVPDGFQFSVKIPRTISHTLRLRNADSTMRAFLDGVTALGEKLGCLLLQLPPSLALNPPAANDFFTMLRRLTNVRVVCEPRHESWFTPASAALMTSAGIACVRAHPLPVPNVEPAGHLDTLYIRLHGAPKTYYSAYDEVFLDAVALKITDAHRAGSEVWCIFDNTARGEAIPNALSLMKLLGAAPQCAAM